MKTAERDMARKLRREQGLSIKEIERRLGVSRSSVSIWVRDIVLTPEQRETLHGSNAAFYRQALAHFVHSARCRQRRFWWQVEGRSAALQGDAFHAAGCMLFWAEGSKMRNGAQIANADPEIVRFFVTFLRRYFDVPDEKIRVACNLFTDHADRQREIEDFWLGVAGVPRSSLTKTMVNRYSR